MGSTSTLPGGSILVHFRPNNVEPILVKQAPDGPILATPDLQLLTSPRNQRHWLMERSEEHQPGTDEETQGPREEYHLGDALRHLVLVKFCSAGTCVVFAFTYVHFSLGVRHLLVSLLVCVGLGIYGRPCTNHLNILWMFQEKTGQWPLGSTTMSLAG